MHRICCTTFAIAFATLCFAAPSGPLRPSAEQALQIWTDTVNDAQQALKSGRLPDAIRLAEAAIAEARTFGAQDTHVARALVLRAEIYLWEKKPDRAEAAFKDAVAECERAVGPHSPELVHPLSSLGNFYYYVQPHYDRVAALFERIVDIVDHATPQDDEQVIMWSRNLATIYQQMGDFARAEPLFARAVALTEKLHPEWSSHEQLTQARFYREWKKYDRATEIASRALEWRERALKADATNVDRKLDLSVALDELAAIYLAAEKLDLAETTARQSLANVDTFMGPTNSERGPRLASLADILRARKKFDEAAATFRQLVTLTETSLGPESIPLADVLTKYAGVLRELQQTDEAAKLEARAASMRSKLTTAS
jgi:tetratricopeptide (TPR) repeat protein